MKEENNQSQDEEKKIVGRIKKYSGMTTYSIFITCILLVILSSGATYWWMNKNAESDIKSKNDRILTLEKKISKLEKDLADEKKSILGVGETGTSETTDESCDSVAPNETAQENIIASVNVANTQPLEGYMADSVNVILAATEAYGTQTKTEAALDISSFVSDSISTWDFALPASVLSSYGAGGYGQYFPNNAIVGKASGGKVISFSFDCNGKISTVFMASAEELLE